MYRLLRFPYFFTLFLFQFTILICNPQFSFSNEVDKINWTTLLPEGVYDFMPEGEITEEIWRDSKFQENLYNAGIATVKDIDGKYISITGFMVPLEVDYFAGQKVTEFLLVPSACMGIHVPPPPPNQMMLVRSKKSIPVRQIYQPIRVFGNVKIENVMGEMTENVYTLDLEDITDTDFSDLDLGR